MLESILPVGVQGQESWGRPPPAEFPFAEEQRIVADAVESRRREYAWVRSCARACMARLDHPATAIVPGTDGAPTWPVGLRGSMTHCEGYCAAALGPVDAVAAIGIDAEPDEPLPDGVWEVITTVAERRRFADPPAAPGAPNLDRLLFSAKEAVYKAWSPLVGEWLDHQEVEISLSPGTGRFTAELLRPGLVLAGRPITHLSGWWTRQRATLLTVVALT